MRSTPSTEPINITIQHHCVWLEQSARVDHPRTSTRKIMPPQEVLLTARSIGGTFAGLGMKYLVQPTLSPHHSCIGRGGGGYQGYRKAVVAVAVAVARQGSGETAGLAPRVRKKKQAHRHHRHHHNHQPPTPLSRAISHHIEHPAHNQAAIKRHCQPLHPRNRQRQHAAAASE